MRKQLLITALFLLGITAASAADLYVYSASKTGAVAQVKNVKLIEFGNGAVNLVDDAGAQSKVQVADFDYMLFYQKQGQTGISPNLAAAKARIGFDGNTITVAASQDITQVEVYATSGALVSQARPNAKSAQLDASALAAGVYLVKAATGNETTISKILKR